jgi:cobalt-zinc-cadmium resistance protein CzcA
MDERIAFCISAGVGFSIFGIAVLNGIVLIEHFKELKHQGMKSIDELILKGPLTDCVPFC